MPSERRNGLAGRRDPEGRMPSNNAFKPAPGPRAMSPEILVVDDDRAMVEAFSSWLSAEGFKIRTAFDGVEAIEKIEDSVPDLVVADITMPRMNGIALANQLRDRGIPVILMSAAPPPAAELPEVPFVAKPFEIDHLVDAIRELLQNSAHSWDGWASRSSLPH